jgi:ATP-dependent DNA ligase
VSRNGRNWSTEMVAIRAAVLDLPAARIVLDGVGRRLTPEKVERIHRDARGREKDNT